MTTSGDALIIVHEPGNEVGMVGDGLARRGWRLHDHLVTDGLDRPDRWRRFPLVDRFDLVVVMGSGHSVHDTATVGAWIGAELDLIARSHRSGRPVLGICFGGQALAAALGGSVAPAPRGEIGWYHLDGPESPVGPGPWFEWHHDRFIPPPGAITLATTPAANQLFRIGRSVGTQFHPEVDLDHIAGWVATAAPGELEDLGVDADELLVRSRAEARPSAERCRALVDWYLDDVLVGI